MERDQMSSQPVHTPYQSNLDNPIPPHPPQYQLSQNYFIILNMYVFDDPQDTPTQQPPTRQTQLIKVKSKHHDPFQTHQQSYQTPTNDLIFAFQENQDQQLPQSIQQKSEHQEQDPQKQSLQDLAQLPKYSPEPRTFQDGISAKSQNQSLLSVRNHKNQFVIERILFFPQKFFLYDQEGNLLISARKKLIEINSVFYFFSGEDMSSTKNSNYLGYMISDSSNEYRLYSTDDIPLASYEYSIQKNTPGEIVVCIGSKKTRSMKSISEQVVVEPENVFYLHNRQPEKNTTTGKYSTSLQGLAKIPSSKNCAIIYRQRNSLIMGKEKQKHYNLHYGDPWTDYIAFSFAISNYEQKDIQ